jgi:glutamate/tyrosine decarboxylase-like PLP-dependent enzyme
MNGTSKTKALVYLLAVFLAGIITGGVGGALFAHHCFRPPPPPRRDLPAHIVNELKRDLQLTDDQVRQLQPLVQASVRETVEGIIAGMHRTDRQIERLLTAEQGTRLHERSAKHEQEMRDSLHPASPPPP